jgi:hypothetical protein
MKYYNKDYADFIVDDEKEKKLIDERNRMKVWYHDPALKLEYQKRLVKHGSLFIAFWLLMAIFYLALVAYSYFGPGDTVRTIGYSLLSIIWGLGAILYYYEVAEARKAISKAPVMKA